MADEAVLRARAGCLRARPLVALVRRAHARALAASRRLVRVNIVAPATAIEDSCLTVGGTIVAKHTPRLVVALPRIRVYLSSRARREPPRRRGPAARPRARGRACAELSSVQCRGAPTPQCPEPMPQPHPHAADSGLRDVPISQPLVHRHRDVHFYLHVLGAVASFYLIKVRELHLL